MGVPVKETPGGSASSEILLMLRGTNSIFYGLMVEEGGGECEYLPDSSPNLRAITLSFNLKDKMMWIPSFDDILYIFVLPIAIIILQKIRR